MNDDDRDYDRDDDRDLDHDMDRDDDRDLDHDMDRDDDLGIRGAMDKAKGKAQETWGGVTGDDSDVAEGKLKRGKGNREQGAGRAEPDIDSGLDQ